MDPTLPIFYTWIVLTGALMATWLYAGFAVRVLMVHLRDHHSDRWCYLMSAPLFGEGIGPNGFRLMRYVLSEDDNDDPNVLSHKMTIKRRMRVAAGIFGAMLLIVVVIAVGIMTGILGA